MTLAALRQLVAQGEGPTLEFKRTTGKVREGLETVCAFLNGAGGRVLFGVSRTGALEGQQVSEQTLHELAAALDRFEPPVAAKITRTKVLPGREVLAVSVAANQEAVPYTFEGRAFERVGNTTRKMTQARYEALLLQRAHARRRWENQPAVSVRLTDLDREEVLRTREVAIQQRRISAGTGAAIGDILDRLGLRRDGVITQAAQALYGTKFLPDYPQGLLKLGRFRGTTVTGPILDNRQEYLHAFAMVREGLAFLERTLPLGAQFPEGKIFREDRLALPPNALREILLNAVMHRDYADPGGYVAIAVFDDRVEIRSVGRLPAGITAAMLTGPHLSRPRNPLIADTFHRTGAVEIWGRGTNRVIEECRRYGVPPPTFEEQGGAVVVTFRAPIGAGTKSGPSRDQVGTKLSLSRDQRAVLRLGATPQPIHSLMTHCGKANRTKFRDQVLRPLLDAGLLAMTVPEKPRSSKQQYRTTQAGAAGLEDGPPE